MLPAATSTPALAFDEETARSELYALLATLYYAPASPELIARLRLAVTDRPTTNAPLEALWRALVTSARALTVEAIQSEYNALFGGVGKPEVYLYGSHYLSGFLNEKPLARLRTTLGQLGLTRADAMPETEDHLAYLCEVMRYLIAAADDVAAVNLKHQRDFFAQHLQPWVMLLCDDLEHHPKAHFYAALAALTRAFMGVERQGFDLLN